MREGTAEILISLELLWLQQERTRNDGHVSRTDPSLMRAGLPGAHQKAQHIRGVAGTCGLLGTGWQSTWDQEG